MGVFDEMKGDFMKLVATLGAIGAFVVLFLLWSTMGIWAIVVLLVVLIGGFFVWNYYRNGGAS